jgi:hypothetical protein
MVSRRGLSGGALGKLPLNPCGALGEAGDDLIVEWMRRAIGDVLVAHAGCRRCRVFRNAT